MARWPVGGVCTPAPGTHHQSRTLGTPRTRTRTLTYGLMFDSQLLCIRARHVNMYTRLKAKEIHCTRYFHQEVASLSNESVWSEILHVVYERILAASVPMVHGSTLGGEVTVSLELQHPTQGSRVITLSYITRLRCVVWFHWQGCFVRTPAHLRHRR